MSDFEKLGGKLDEISTKIRDYEKSNQAVKDIAEKGLDSVKAELDAQKKQLQAFADKAKQIESASKCDPSLLAARAVGEFIVKKAAGTGTAAAGGAVVDDEVLRIIQTAQNQFGVVRQIFGSEIIPMATDTLTIPVDVFEVSGVSGTGNTPTPASTSENAAITESADATLGQLTLTASKYATLNYISNELISDSFVDFVGAYLLPKIARQMAKKEDQIVLVDGLLASSSIREMVLDSGATSFMDTTFDDLFFVEDEIVSDALSGAEFLLHRSLVNVLRSLKGTNGQYLWTPAAAGEPASIAGYPYMRAEVMPTRLAASQADTSFMLFGDIKLGCKVGEVGQRTIRTSEEYRFNQDQLAVRMTERFAWNTDANIGRAICKITTAAE